MLTLSQVTKSFHGRVLFEEASLQLNRGDRIGLVGPNGAGKSTLLAVILGREQPDAGNVVWERGANYGYLPQESAAVGEETVLQLACAVSAQMAEALAPGARVAVLSSRMGSIGLRAAPNSWLYRASKAAVNSVLKDASLALAGQAVCVAFHPGWVRTDMGGANADIDVTESVAGIRRTLAGLSESDNGNFFNYDGQPLAW